MKTEIEELQGHYKKIKIEVPADDVNQTVNSHYKGIQKNVELKGFRKGKAPLHLVKEMYKDSANGQIIQKLVEEHLRKALVDNKLNPANMPQIDVESLSEGQPFEFSATFEVIPEVELKDYANFKAKKAKIEVQEKEIEETLKNIQNQMAELVDALEGSAIKDGIVARMSYEASEEGKSVPEASDKEVNLEIGSGSLPPGFEKELIGMKAGEVKNFTVDFPKTEGEAQPAPLAGRKIDFKTTVHSLHYKKLPEIDDAMAKKVGDFENLAKLKERVKTDITRQKDQNHRMQVEEELVEYLLKEHKIEVPETMLQEQVKQLAIDTGMQLQQQGLPQESIEERLKEWENDLKEKADKQVKTSLLLSAISEKEGIQATDEDLRSEIMRIASQSGKKPDDVVQDLQEKRLMSGLIRQVTELKTLGWLTQKAVETNEI